MLKVKILRAMKVFISVCVLCMAISLGFKTLDVRISCAICWGGTHQNQASQQSRL